MSDHSSCLLPLHVGIGGSGHSECLPSAGYRFYYNYAEKKCGRFWYMGCQGNDNRHSGLEECELLCGDANLPFGLRIRDTTPINPADCFLPKEPGQCAHVENDKSTRYFYDSNAETCAAFNFNGCNGNANNFGTRGLCEQTCGGMKKPFNVTTCAHWPSTGDCNRLRWMWSFNVTTGFCDQFLWGGCDGNSNRFDTYAQCQKQCEIAGSDPCSEPLDRGTMCVRLQFRYYFKQSTKTCEGFHYGGCGESANNFQTSRKCHDLCVYKNDTLDGSLSLGAGGGAGEYQGTEPPNERQLERHVFLSSKEKRYLKSDNVHLDENQCVGYRYNISGAYSIVNAFLCLMDSPGGCISERLHDTHNEEHCDIMRPWVTGYHLYAWYFTLDSRAERFDEFTPNSTIQSRPVATIMMLDVNRCFDAC